MSRLSRCILCIAILTVTATALFAQAPQPPVLIQGGAHVVTTDEILVQLFSAKEPCWTAEHGLTAAGETALAQIDKLSVFAERNLIDPLVRELGSDQRAHSAIATYALARVGTITLPPLVRIVRTPKDPRRQSAVEAIGLMGPKAPTTVPALRQLLSELSDADAALRTATVQALQKIGTPDALAAAKEYETKQPK